VGLLYIDSSVLLTVALRQHGHEAVRATLSNAQAQGMTAVSSRLLWLEARRVIVREQLEGDDVAADVDEALATIGALPLTEDVWQRALSLEQHVKSLDALHVATCELVGATLLTARLDGGIRSMAEARGIPLA
jgi:predicted nucleic acid-binding protein